MKSKTRIDCSLRCEGFEEWRRKYEALGAFGDSWFGKVKIPFKFHLESRDLVLKHIRDPGKSKSSVCDQSAGKKTSGDSGGDGDGNGDGNGDDDGDGVSDSNGDADGACELERLYKNTMVFDRETDEVNKMLSYGRLIHCKAVADLVQAIKDQYPAA